MTPPPPTPADPLPQVPSPGAFVSILFPRSSSPSYPAALAVSRAASFRADASVGSRVVHLAEFTPSPPQAGAAVALLHYVATWRGVQVFVAGRPTGGAWGTLETVERVLRCFADSGACSDVRAHCMTIHRALYDDAGPHTPALFPCRHILRVYPAPLSCLHPSGPVAQIEARAVAAMCDWCPIFRPAAFIWNLETFSTSGSMAALPQA